MNKKIILLLLLLCSSKVVGNEPVANLVAENNYLKIAASNQAKEIAKLKKIIRKLSGDCIKFIEEKVEYVDVETMEIKSFKIQREIVDCEY